MSRQTRWLMGLTVAGLLVAAGLVAWPWLRPQVREEEPDDDGPPLPDGALLLGSTAFNVKGTVGPWALFDGGKRIVFANGRWLRIVDADTKAEIRSWVADKRFPMSMAVSSDSRQIANTSGYDEYIRVWDAATGKLISKFNPHRSYAKFWVTLSPDGKYTASVGWEREKADGRDSSRLDDTGIRVCNSVTGEEHPLFQGGIPGANGPAFSPNGNYFAWVDRSHNPRILLRPLNGGQDRDFAAVPEWRGHTGRTPIAFSHDGKLLAAHLADGGALVWDIASGKERKRFAAVGKDPAHHNFTFHTLRFAPDNNTLLLGRATERSGESQSLLLLHDVAAGSSRVLARDAPIQNGVEFSGDGKTVITLRTDRNITAWDVATGKEHSPPGHKGAVWAVALSTDGKTVATAGFDKTIRLWDRSSGKELRVLEGHPAGAVGVAFLTDGKGLVSADWDGTIIVWSVDSGKEIKRFTSHKAGLDGFALSPDGSILATGGRDKFVRLWNTDNWTERKAMMGHPGWVVRVVFTPDGRRLLSTGRTRHRTAKGDHLAEDEFFRMWDVATGAPVGEFNNLKVRGDAAVVLSPDGKRAVSFTNPPTVNVGKAQEWEVATGRLLREVGPVDKGALPLPLAWSPDGQTVAVRPGYYGGEGGALIQLLDATTWKETGRLRGHAGWVNAAVYSSDGRYLVSASDDGTAIVWDLSKSVTVK